MIPNSRTVDEAVAARELDSRSDPDTNIFGLGSASEPAGPN